MNKLNTRIEDEKEPDVALKKLLNLIKLAICKNNTGKLRLSTLDDIANSIFESYELATERFSQIQTWITANSQVNCQQFQTPERSVGCGGSVVGRKNKKAIKFVLDHAATKMNRPINIHVLLGKIDPEKDLNRTPSNGKLSCSISPTSFPSLISLFKSPDIPIVDEDTDIPEETLSKRLGLDKILGNGKIKEEKTRGIPKFDANLAWAENTSPILISPEAIKASTDESPVLGRVFLHVQENEATENIGTPTGRSKTSTSRVAEIIAEGKQNAEMALKEARQAVKPPKKNLKRSILQDINKVNKFPIAASNSTKISNDAVQNAGKQIKVSGQENLPQINATKQKTTAKKKKLVPLKGQMKMTAFLRM